ncbi:hypothetical protein [Rubellimicrobium aerolatum]|uniref:Thiol:disulfide interchange protein DsbD N-terminal domain-containing protein n=1 Tax=Rubellimicrobium aerolatum TaxID=490979 RepID=A0ABW0SD25_9RHOB|nr:hypothetical protein [Rubellimicrobium aerolatum]MBP1806738.1 hypothetical protein [Rubellimicrobium aerolatum]
MPRRLLALLLSILPLPALAQGQAVASQGGLTLRLALAPEASAALAEAGESVVVRVWLYGEPASPEAPVNEVGLVDLGVAELTVAPGDARLTVGGLFGPGQAALVTEPFVNVNVFTARLSDEANLLACDALDEPLAQAARREPVLACRLLAP